MRKQKAERLSVVELGSESCRTYRLREAAGSARNGRWSRAVANSALQDRRKEGYRSYEAPRVRQVRRSARPEKARFLATGFRVNQVLVGGRPVVRKTY